MARIVVVGEGMLELSRVGAHWRLGHGGDTLNTAIHLARLGRGVSYATALGADAFSETLRTAWSAEGLDISLILTDPDRQPGLYAISTDPLGERSFGYWRGESAARQLFALPGVDRMIAAAETADLLVFSLISLAILPPEGRAALFDLCHRVRARGGRVAFDNNYRPRLWESAATARAACDQAIALTDIGLPTIDDDIALADLPANARDAAAVRDRWRALGAREIVVKLGGAGCLVDNEIVPPSAVLTPIDTSGAGDAFNAGYLHARLAGIAPHDAARVGHRLAGWVIMRPGAVPASAPDAPYQE
ncbi:sugar kinase [Sphingomonas sp. SUN019]|uniref:sugar kinase n=1 Tax=Sphingomonas sp. SUN019 TaxID=2937788 RepID=UPI0021640CDE|nr:sugar kinase [Sphingomonas sp. SUN019]UVO49696.1 sugar kinase [Sphingomonas sp. SUN019]